MAWTLARRGSLVLAAVLGFAVLGGSVWGYRILTALEGGPKRPLDDVLEGYDPGGPRNVLILGSDTRKGLTKEEKEKFGSEADVPDDRTDTIILMHLDPERDRAIVVHFPRDLRVRIPGEGLDKINAAYDYGGGGTEGATLAIRTVEEFSGLEINNYIEISLAGFQDLVDTLGGVEMCIPEPLYDELAGLDLDAGCQTLDGFSSLAYVRARHLPGDAIPDFSRISRQQQFMRALVNRMLSLDSLLDTNVIKEAARQVTTDDQLTGTDLIYLASELRKVAQTDPSGASLVDFRAVPSTPAFIGGVSYVIAEQPAARKLFRRIEEGRPLGEIGTVLEGTAISEANITTRVLRAASTAVADDVDQLLRDSGFVVLPQREAPAGRRRTEILFRPGEDAMADVLAGYFPAVPVHEGPASILGQADVVLVVGRDYRSALE